MELLVLDDKFTAIKLLDTFESLIWTERYYACGDFELYIPVSTELISLFKSDYYLWLKEADNAMIVETKQIETDVDDGSKLVITGRGLESILERRVIYYPTLLSGSLQQGIKQLLYDNIISPSDPDRRIDNFIFKDSTDSAITGLVIQAQFHGENLYETIQTICETNKIGFRVTLNHANQFVFELYSGEDRSYEQNKNPYVVFSPDFDNLVNSNYLESNKTLKTFALVGGEGEGAERIMTTATSNSGAGSGLGRREIFVEAHDVSKNVDGEEISNELYLAQLAQKGREGLAENIMTRSFEGQCETSRMFIYGEDFFMGDIVQVSNEYDIDARTRVTEFIRSQDTNGFDSYPTFETVDDINPIVLPEGYTEYAYITGTGSQYIDTGYKPNSNTRLKMDFSISTLSESWRGIYGSRVQKSTGLVDMFALFLTFDNHEIISNGYHGNFGTQSYYSATSFQFGRHKIDHNRNVVTIDNTTIEMQSETFASTIPLCLFVTNDSENRYLHSDINLYSCEIYDDDVLVRKFVPCSDPNGTIGLYDVVTAKFYGNAGTGTFKGVVKASLPYGCVQVEYLESTGTQWIDTGFFPSPATDVEMLFAFTNPVAGQRLFSSRGGLQYVTYIHSNGQYAFIYQDDTFSGTVTGVVVDTKKHSYILSGSGKKAIIDDVQTNDLSGFTTTLTSTQSLRLLRDSNDNSNAVIRLNTCSIRNNGVLECSFIPVIDANGVACMYERITKRLLYNAGTGNFIAGPEIS